MSGAFAATLSSPENSQAVNPEKTGVPEEKHLDAFPNVVVTKMENSTTIVSGGVKAETTEPVKATDSGVFIGSSEIKILPDAVQEIAKKAGASVVTSMKIESKNDTAVYSIHGYSEKRLFGILPVKVGYEILLSAKEGYVQKISRPWWDLFAI